MVVITDRDAVYNFLAIAIARCFHQNSGCNKAGNIQMPIITS